VNASKVFSYFRDLIDEPEYTFVSSANISTYLDIGYGQFRREVANIDPLVYAKVVSFTVTGSATQDLTALSTPVLGGSAAAGNRLQQIVSLQAINGDGDVVYAFSPVGNVNTRSVMRHSYTLEGSTIRFTDEVSETIRLTYLPDHSVVWTNDVYFDDLTMFHDVIALMAYAQYAMRDGVENAALLRQLAQRTLDLKEYVGSRNLESASYVQRTGWDDPGWL